MWSEEGFTVTSFDLRILQSAFPQIHRRGHSGTQLPVHWPVEIEIQTERQAWPRRASAKVRAHTAADTCNRDVHRLRTAGIYVIMWLGWWT